MAEMNGDQSADLAEKAMEIKDKNSLNQLAIGAIEVDVEGNIQYYSRAESELTGLEPDEVVGKNFFRDVAPCCRNRNFLDHFEKVVQKKAREERFEYLFTDAIKPVRVKVILKSSLIDDDYWIFIKKKD